MLAFELSAHGPFVLAGVVVGVFAFLPMWLALEPVLRRGREANMNQGDVERRVRRLWLLLLAS